MDRLRGAPTGDWKRLIRKWGAALALVAIFVGGIGISVFVLFGNTPAADTGRPPTPPRAPVAPKVPISEEFNIGVIVTEQNCPSAGDCVYTYTIQPHYIGLHPLPDHQVAVKYEIHGGHEVQHGEFTVRGTEARIMKDVTVAGPPGVQLSAIATQVISQPEIGPPSPNTPMPAPSPR